MVGLLAMLLLLVSIGCGCLAEAWLRERTARRTARLELLQRRGEEYSAQYWRAKYERADMERAAAVQERVEIERRLGAARAALEPRLETGQAGGVSDAQ